MTTFRTDTGILVEGISAQQMREVDRIATDGKGPNLLQMMENAGRNLAEFIVAELGQSWRKSVIVILAGFAGNGGGGICAARHLTNRGANVTLLLTGTSVLRKAVEWQYHLFRTSDGREITSEELPRLRPDLIVDALIGYGLNGPPGERVVELIQWANAAKSPVVSLDVPSGLDATTGQAPGVSMRAISTLTLALPKSGLDSPLAGDLFLADIGIPASIYKHLGMDYSSPFDHRYVVPIKRETGGSR